MYDNISIWQLFAPHPLATFIVDAYSDLLARQQKTQSVEHQLRRRALAEERRLGRANPLEAIEDAPGSRYGHQQSEN